MNRPRTPSLAQSTLRPVAASQPLPDVAQDAGRVAPQVSVPKISVVVPTFSPGELLNRVVRSVEAQTMPAEDFEVIFVDDGSPDDTGSG